MLCWSCGKEIAENATRCSHCEADVVESPGEQEMDKAREFLEGMDPDAMSELRRVFESSKTGEEFVNRIMVGDCPLCASSKTGDCEHDPDVEDISMGRCFDCGHIWCTFCDSPYVPGHEICPVCSELDAGDDDWPDEDAPELDRYHLLAAEIFGYSFANYLDHLGIGNVRYEKYMPDDARLLEQAVVEGWPISQVATALSPDEPMDEPTAEKLLRGCRDALHVIDAENAAESFRHGTKLCVSRALRDGLQDEESVNELVRQICYRASDLAVLLELEGQTLSRYSRHLRREPDVDYYDGYFDEQ